MLMRKLLKPSKMGQLNRIEIRGIIGSVRIQNVGDTKVANISVATNYSYTAKDGGMVIETTWHYVTAWEGREIKNLDQLQKGFWIHIIGRLRNRKYVAADGTERIAYDIVASKVVIMERPQQRV